jgi:alpha-galactosidase
MQEEGIIAMKGSIPFTAALMLVVLAAELSAQSSRPDSEPANATMPLKVFVLAGQSNMQGHAHVRTLDAMSLDPKTAPILEQIRNADGTMRVCDRVWISSIGSADQEQIGKLTAGFGAQSGGPKIGPELTFGIFMHERLDEPVLLIKTAWGGKSLHTDFRPPGAGPYEFDASQIEGFRKQGRDIEAIQAEKAKATGHYYRLMIDHVKQVLADIQRVVPEYNAQQGYELAGFVWFQGWNDMVDQGTYPRRNQPGGYDQYSKLLAQFIRDVRTDLSAPNLPFVIGVMGVGGPVAQYRADQQRYKDVHQNFRNAMAAPAALPEFQGNVVAVLTEQYWDLQVVDLREREKQLKQQVDEINRQVKEGQLLREDGRAALEKLYAETFTPRELAILKESTSNFDFHYMGSAKILAQIGKGFAEAMAKLQ